MKGARLGHSACCDARVAQTSQERPGRMVPRSRTNSLWRFSCPEISESIRSQLSTTQTALSEGLQDTHNSLKLSVPLISGLSIASLPLRTNSHLTVAA